MDWHLLNTIRWFLLSINPDGETVSTQLRRHPPPDLANWSSVAQETPVVMFSISVIQAFYGKVAALMLFSSCSQVRDHGHRQLQLIVAYIMHLHQCQYYGLATSIRIGLPVYLTNQSNPIDAIFTLPSSQLFFCSAISSTTFGVI